MASQIPAVDYLVLGDDPHLVAQECISCGALFFDRRNACASCFAIEFQLRVLATTGTVASYTIVSRAAPSVPTPYTSAIVDLDGGGSVKANLIGITEPDMITRRLPVVLTTFVVGTDDDDTDAVAFGFIPRGDPA